MIYRCTYVFFILEVSLAYILGISDNLRGCLTCSNTFTLPKSNISHLYIKCPLDSYKKTWLFLILHKSHNGTHLAATSISCARVFNTDPPSLCIFLQHKAGINSLFSVLNHTMKTHCSFPPGVETLKQLWQDPQTCIPQQVFPSGLRERENNLIRHPWLGFRLEVLES